MHIHILGICGTFMGSLALLAREAGHRVTGSDRGIYPPMSELLAGAGIPVEADDDPGQLDPAPDCVIVGNALSRGHPVVEAVLDRGLPYTSGPQWLAEHVLRDRWVLAVSGTHGKTTTAGALAWILESAGLSPGFLIGGAPGNFPVSARLGGSPFFVIEADEYDSAFFDKRSKFVHFRPRTLVINNLEYDHADIFPDLAAIQRQFHHLVRTVPGTGQIIAPTDDPAVSEVLGMGCWSECVSLGHTDGWHVSGDPPEIRDGTTSLGTVEWPLRGHHNAANALAALLAARHVGVPPEQGIAALGEFRGMRRRQELRGSVGGIQVIDDFAHHPSAIGATLEALRPDPGARLLAVVEARSNSMRMGVHRAALPEALAAADRVVLYQAPGTSGDLEAVVRALGTHARLEQDLEALVAHLATEARRGDRVVIMSNGAFGGIHERLLDALRRRHETHGEAAP